VLRFVGPDEVVNAVGVVVDTRNPTTVTALESLTIWLMHRQPILRLLQQESGLAGSVVQSLAGEVGLTDPSYANRRAKTRVAGAKNPAVKAGGIARSTTAH
jgi:CRP-like cAMP-binding protein